MIQSNWSNPYDRPKVHSCRIDTPFFVITRVVTTKKSLCKIKFLFRFFVSSVNNRGSVYLPKVLDFDKNIYDEILTIEFLCKIRDQIKFDSIDDLKNQIQKDKEKAESLLKDYEQ